MAVFSYDRYYGYAELTAALEKLAAEHPELVRLESLGKSHEGREIWLVTVTASKTGPAEAKPAVWADGNIHATELSASSACLYLLEKLVSGYGADAGVTRLLDTRAFYVAPRVNPDGAEWALERPPRRIRSSTRPYPHDEEPPEGLIERDIDGDGRLLWMRVPDPNGPWKPHPEHPRLMVRRAPEDVEGDFYWLFPEGEIRNYDGSLVKVAPKKEGLDLNRNFPGTWRAEHEQRGAGPFPASEPEVHHLVRFLSSRTNITSGVTFHTWSGVLLRPSCIKPDEDLPAEDLWVFKEMGDRGTAITGYPNISVYHDFRYHPKQVITGDFDEWAYDHRGMFTWTCEIWSPQRQAGIEMTKFIDWYRDHPLEDDIKLLRWSDEKLGGRGYVDWYAVEHPQLGTVELGGWDMDFCWRNPPVEFLEAEIAPLADWMIWQGWTTPLLSLHKLEVKALGGDRHRVELVVENTGWLPSYGARKALERKVCRGVLFEIALPGDAELESGALRHEGPQLEGRAGVHSAATPWSLWNAQMDNRAKCVWVVRAAPGTEFTVCARHDRAGKVVERVRVGRGASL